MRRSWLELQKLNKALDKLVKEFRCDDLHYLHHLLLRSGRTEDTKVVEAWWNYWKK